MMVFNEGDVLVQESTGDKYTVIMTNTFNMTLESHNEDGVFVIMQRQDPEDFRMAREEELPTVDDIFKEMGMTEDLGLNEVRLELYFRHLEHANFDVDKAIQKTRDVMFAVFHDKEALDV